MEVAQNIKDEFIIKFQEQYPEISEVIDFEINRYGNILSSNTTNTHFILNNICFYKKDEVSEKEFKDTLSIFRTNEEVGVYWINLSTMAKMVFDIGDGDDIGAVTFNTINGKITASIWFRWWEDGG